MKSPGVAPRALMRRFVVGLGIVTVAAFGPGAADARFGGGGFGGGGFHGGGGFGGGGFRFYPSGNSRSDI